MVLDIGLFILSVGAVVIVAMLVFAAALACAGLVMSAATYAKECYWEHGKWL